ncbi:hypothetical protein GCM10011611_15530 [Aliidongia dinghuensis]|uniref:Uncharacterized protein n=1 Tax=Aliidongia dinghuensis TaxID=1867774 RepID=A0A8J2YR36_9PROT|nr:hypothetical protein GCM10011611_15530 [Aliidongia dinghuensis]
MAGIVYLMAWVVMNDEAKHIDDQTGLLRMTRPKRAATPSAEEPKAAPRHGRRARPLGEPITNRWASRPGRPQSARPLPGRAKPVVPTKPPVTTPMPAPAREAEEEIIHPLWQGRRRPGQRR